MKYFILQFNLIGIMCGYIQLVKLILCISFPLLIGGLSGAAVADGVSGWYRSAQKPHLQPPDYVFPIVWTFLYTLMGISFFLLLHQPNSRWKSIAIFLFLLQIMLNFLWSFLFFKFRMPGIAFIEIILLWLFIIMMIWAMYRVQPLIGYLQIPYAIWVGFAALLNALFWWLNR